MKIETLTATGEVVNGAKCLVTNDRNDTAMRSGDSVSVRRSGTNLVIECSQPGQAPATGQAVSRANVGMVGNILIGGVIGAAIDSGTGAGFNYPSWMRLVFGEVRNFDRSSQTGDEAMDGMRLGATEVAAGMPPAPKVVAATPPQQPRAAPVPEAVVKAEPVPPPVLVAPTVPVPVPAPQPRSDARVSMDDLRGLLPAKP
ncbi:hypothetical protein VLK31_27255 [Variovorax sp. H27-G14]|uniref:hypothetical protein n=1 Tax=Variovorax sp. H27-G14 TaxID=3111914 RepID=UPI0038FC6CE9